MESSSLLIQQLHQNTSYFKEQITAAGFELKPTQSAICAIMLYDAALAQQFAEMLLEKGIYVVGFSYPVVPQGQARIRVQLSAAHAKGHLNRAIEAFVAVGKQLGVI